MTRCELSVREVGLWKGTPVNSRLGLIHRGQLGSLECKWHCRGVGFWTPASINHWLLPGVGDASKAFPGCGSIEKPKAGLQRKSPVLAVSLHSQQLPGGCSSMRLSGQSPKSISYTPRLPQRGSWEHWAFMPITVQMSDTRTCSQLFRNGNQANLALGFP